ncbi:MAG: TolC family protein [Ginsengibacter sp.]
MYRKHYLFLCMMVILTTGLNYAKAQDTLYMNIQTVQSTFMKQNLDLMVARFEIDKASAQITQAQLLNNPEFEIIANAYNPEDRKIMDVSNKTGDYAFRLEQLFTLGGKRKKASRFAQTQYDYSQNSFSEFLRDLLFSLRSNFYTLHFLQETYQKLNSQVEGLKNLTNSYYRLQEKQLVTLNDALRIKSLYFSLLSDITEIVNQMEDIQNELRVLLNLPDKTFLIQQAETSNLPAFPAHFTLKELVDSARNNRPDLKMARTNILMNEQAYLLEKSLAIPDLKVGAAYARRDAFVPKATMIDIGLEIPLFNRNQGNIKAAKVGISQAKTEVGIKELRIETEIQSTYSKAMNANKTLLEMDDTFFTSYETLLKNVRQNLEKQTISLLDFVQFHESYQESVLQFFKLKNEKMQAIEELNHSIGKYIF